MRNKKAKLLRGLAGGTETAVAYEHIPQTVKLKRVSDPLSGEVIGEYKTGTLKMVSGPRLLLKTLKKGYKTATRTA